MSGLLVDQVASQRTWPKVGDIDDCWVLAWMMCQIAVAPWLPWLDATEARAAAGDPDDGVDDGNDRGIWDMVRGVRAATPALGALCRPVNRDLDWDALLPRIKAGRPFAAAVMGGAMPKVYTRVPHQVVLFHEPGIGLRAADPMAPDRSEPYRIATLAAKRACESFAGAGKVVGVLFPNEVEAFPTHPLYRSAGYSQAELDAAVATARMTTATPLQARIDKLHQAASDYAAAAQTM